MASTLAKLPFSLKHLDRCLPTRDALNQVRKLLDKIEKLSGALDQGHNFADILNDASNLSSLRKTFGAETFDAEMDIVFDILSKMALGDHSVRSFVINSEIAGAKKLQFLHRSVGGWKQFDAVVCLRLPDGTADRNTVLINSARAQDWERLQTIPKETLVTVSLRTASGKRSRAQETLALERYEAIFDVAQNRPEEMAKPAALIQFPVAAVESAAPAAAPKASTTPARTVAKRPSSPAPSIRDMARAMSAETGGKTPVVSFTVVVNKMDTVVHAGNAQLILSHIRDYGGRVAMFVLRGEKKMVRMDADSIWGAEIRNGETVLFEFFGSRPADQFIKDLAQKVNKYTQMDKLVNE